MATAPPQAQAGLETPLPSKETLLQAARIAQQSDRPIQLDYYADSYFEKAVIGEDKQTKEKVLLKSQDEYTSVISKIYKSEQDYLILTENSLYVVSGKIKKREILASQLTQTE